MKQQNKVKRLEARQQDYDDMMAGEGKYRGKLRPSCQEGYHRPGSLKK